MLLGASTCRYRYKRLGCHRGQASANPCCRQHDRPMQAGDQQSSLTIPNGAGLCSCAGNSVATGCCFFSVLTHNKQRLPDCWPMPLPTHTFVGLSSCACLRARAACLPPLVAAGFCEGTACTRLAPPPDVTGSVLLACDGLEGARLVRLLPWALPVVGPAALWAAARGMALVAGCWGCLEGAAFSRLM